MDFLVKSLRSLVRLTAGIAGLGLLSMMMVTCLDVILRKLGHPLPGAYDLVKVAAGVTIVTLWHLLHPGKTLVKP